jgi:serine phosphatase RsbU (regulator of sigma subunit)
MRSLLTAIFLFAISVNGISQEVIFPVRNYTTRDYGRDFHPVNWSVLQDNRGIIYAANGFKLLEYDGNNWNSYPINKEAWILSLIIDTTGIIYAGSFNEFGCFIPDESGRLIYNSISDSLDLSDFDFTNVWKAHSFTRGIAFQSEEKLFVYRDGKIKVIKPETSFHTSFLVNDGLYVRQRGTGLMKWKNDSLIHVKGSEIFDTTGVFMMIPARKGSSEILIGTQGKGFWLFDPESPGNGFRKFPVENLSLLEGSRITGGILTNNDLYAVSTMLSGLILIDPTGKIVSVIDRENGLADNDVKQVVSDHSGNLWLATNNGISTVEISSPLSFYSEKSGITGSITSVYRYKNLLYAGTNTGLFRENISVDGTLFNPAFNLTVSVRCITGAEDLLFAGTDNGLYECTGQSIKKINDQVSYSLYYLPEMKLLFSGGPKGLTVFRHTGSFQKTGLLKEINDDIIGISSDKNNSSDSTTIWIGTRNNRVLRLKIYKNLSAKYEYFDSSDGLPGGYVTPYSYNSGTIFGTSAGLFKFIDENEVKKSLPDSLKNSKDFLRGYFTSVSISAENAGSVSYLVDDAKLTWTCSDNMAGYFVKDQNMKYVHQPFSGIDVGKINVLYPEENGLCWIGTSDGLIRYDGNTRKNYDLDFHCLTRRVNIIGNDSVIFNGSFYDPGKGMLPDQPAISRPVLSFGNNSVRFDFSATFFEHSDKIKYSYQINDSRWSQWSGENYQDLTLMEGDYVFRVKAMNVYGKESIPAQYKFTVLPPWYRSFSAYVLYVIAGGLIIWLISWANSYRLKMENLRLEGIVADRTAEVVYQKDEIEKKNTILEHQNKEIEDSIRYARRIQSAVIPHEDLCRDLLPASFIFFRPLDIVSGDFYWISKIENKIIFTAADCTGHGVPGAFMSMLGVAFLNEIVDRDRITEPDTILNLLRKKVTQALQHKGYSGEARDGMDMSLVCIDLKENTLQFSGAYNPMILIRNNEITEINGDKMPVGIYEKMDPFTRHEVKIEKGDVIYLASDGYEDQFGGTDGKKFKAKKFKQMLLEIHKLPMNEQKEIIENRFVEWKGDLKQVDDIIVAGIMIGG